jgi:hypothetical protein
MERDRIEFCVTDLQARVPEGLPIDWQGTVFSTGPLQFHLDQSSGKSAGVMDYQRGRVSVEFRVRMRSDELAGAFCALGVNPGLVSPVRATLWAEGEILPDHSFNGGLRGRCEVQPLGLLLPGAIQVKVLPGL